MTAYLSQFFDDQKNNPSNNNAFFDDDESKKIRDFIYERECPDHTKFPPPCDVNLFFGTFFDGTNNNLEWDEPTHSHSNVARLYNAFPNNGKNPGPKRSGAWKNPDLYYNFFRTYIPGVGTRFDEVGDTGEGSMRTKGLAFAYLAENRILWALVETINNVHRYYLDMPLIDPDRFKASFNKIALPDFGDTRRPVAHDEWGAPPSPYQQLKSLFTEALTDLHKALEMYLPADMPSKKADKGKVRHIYFSLFGFSRGAAQARAFANWFVWLCQLDAKISGRAGLSLGTIPVTFDFMGLFDTVASVGLAYSAPVFGAHGHYAWADSERSLKVCDPAPTQTLHLVSAHEVRRSFPLDSIAFGASLAANCQEIVFPGVHSDIGGGYRPKEQGRGTDAEGADMLSRIPLATMYRAARLAGVPLKLEEAPESVKRSFRVDPSVIRVFNAYVQACAKPAATKEEPVAVPLHRLMAQQHKLYIQWRKKMAGKMASLPSFAASDGHGKEDIRCADREFMEEVARFEAWRDRDPYRDGGDHDRGWPEWEEVDRYWDEPAPSSAVTDLFEQCVHDSRAGFKPFGKDVGDLQLDMEKLAMREEAIADWQRYPVGPAPQPLSAAEKNRLAKYMLYRGTPNASEGIDPMSEGREPMLLGGGFLRYRKIYMGSDRYKPSGAMYSGLLPSRQRSKQQLAVQEGDKMAPVAV